LRRQPNFSSNAAGTPSRGSQKNKKLDNEPLSSHHRSHSHSNSLPSEHRPRLNIPTALYRNPNLPAFVQGPPGSGYPMLMTAAGPPAPHSARAAVSMSPSPPPEIPSTLNPKKSRPTVQRRRPSLSGTTFEPPAQTFNENYRYSNENRDPRGQGSAEPRRVRHRAVSESYRR